MDTIVIKKLIDKYSLIQLLQAEKAIAYDTSLEINIEGSDPGEQFAYIYAAIQVMEAMQKRDIDFKTALKSYSSTVRSQLIHAD